MKGLTKETTRRLDDEDSLGADDGYVHSVTLAVTSTGAHVYFDGYEDFSTTDTTWLRDIQPTKLVVNGSGVADIRRFAVWEGELDPAAALALAVPPQALVEFAGAELAHRDVTKLDGLSNGAVRARFRTRGVGQSGVIFAAEGNVGVLRFGVIDGDLYATLTENGKETERVVAPGHWDDGQVHEVVFVSGRGAVDLYADGYQVVHQPGAFFFGDLGTLQRVVTGMDIDGTRLFGEASTTMVYPNVLTDHQIKRLAGVTPLPTVALFDSGLAGATSYRIPSILTLKSGVVLAGADQRVSSANDSPNDIKFVVRRSHDGGDTWSEPQLILDYPGVGRFASSVIDSVLVQDEESGKVIALIDHFPGGYGQPNAEMGTGFDSQGRKILHDSEGHNFILESDGTVLAESGESTEFVVAKNGDVTRAGHPAGNIYLAPGADPQESLFEFGSCHLLQVTSDDDGETWSEVRDLTPMVKEEWMRFCGTSPGNGIQLKHGKHKGRILMPLYFNTENWLAFSCAVAITDDAGETWRRGGSPNDGRVIGGRIVDSHTLDDDQAYTHESTIVEAADGTVHMWMRNQNAVGRVAHATSTDGGETWSDVDFAEQIPEIFSQLNAIRFTDSHGQEAIAFANASQLLPFRGRGVIRVSYDEGKTWAHNKVFRPRHYVYQCMAQMPDQSIGLFWEREIQGLYFTKLPLEWLEDSLSTIS
ncbi:sialidase-1 [Arcanobacterium wilhelmae]|uniref:exo-alpha-sialidase n=2 Tax=Arcanobacterium wilhelmae TaxID=1803177 RepID=A0ABT9NB60_9ACTO|nr:sialidase-1 [Arcanobacterium wilhelmae]